MKKGGVRVNRYQITVLPSKQILEADAGSVLLDVLAANGCFLPAACGGKGTCGKCRVRLVSGSFEGVMPNDRGEILSCHARVTGDACVEVETAVKGEAERLGDGVKRHHEGANFGAVLDIGTTTLAAALIDAETGTILRTASRLNPQGVCGADVLSRIAAFGEGKGELMQRLLLDAVKQMLLELGDGAPVDTLTVAANTTMLHLLVGEDPTSIGAYPFTPRFVEAREYAGDALGLPVQTVRLLPSVSAYIGADVVAGAIACDMDVSDKTLLLVDVGTNGEILLSHKGKLYAASAAAGPALEGACIECGMGGTVGAVNRVDAQNGILSFDTVGGAEAKGICGCGLIDLISCLVGEGVIDESGAWSEDEECDSPLMRYRREDRFEVCKGVYLSQKDIRQFQLAKAAISAAIEALLAECGVDMSEIDELYLAGGLGYYMNIANAAKIGLIPRDLANRAKAVGNSALQGAVICSCDESARARADLLARRTEVIELSFSQAFGDAYIENMTF